MTQTNENPCTGGPLWPPRPGSPRSLRTEGEPDRTSFQHVVTLRCAAVVGSPYGPTPRCPSCVSYKTRKLVEALRLFVTCGPDHT